MAIYQSPDSNYGNTLTEAGPYYSGTASTAASLVPTLYDISIGGHDYKAETSFEPYRRDAYRSDSIVPVADKTDITNIPGESSVNSEGLWRREATDWEDGAGQLYQDRHGSVESRFRASKGINPWTQWYASLLNDTEAVYTSTTVSQVISAAGYVYIIDNGVVKFSTNLQAWSTVNGVSGALYLATDGAHVYIAMGSNGIYLSTIGSTAAASWVTGTVNFVWYQGGQIVAATNNLLYAIFVSTSTAGPTALTSAGSGGATALLMTNLNASWVWSSCAAGNAWIYVGGYSSTASANIGLVYMTQINSAGTALIAPTISASLPFGEIPYCLYAYGNFLLLGTNFGARLCVTLGPADPGSGGTGGILKLGPIVPDFIQQVGFPIRCFTGFFRFIYFGWSNYDNFSTGLGRMDLSTFIDTQAPAYTSDLMVGYTGGTPVQGEILSADLFNGVPVFVVKGVGVYTQSTALVPSGILDTGFVTWGIADDKIALFARFNATGAGSVGGLVSMDDGAETYTIPPITPSVNMQVSLPQVRGEVMDFMIQLNANSAQYNTAVAYDNTSTYDQTSGGPTLRRWTVKAYPAVVSGTLHKVIINLWPRLYSQNGADIHMDPYKEFAFLDQLRQNGTVIQFVEGTEFAISVIIKSITRLIYEPRGLPEGGFAQRFEIVMTSLEN